MSSDFVVENLRFWSCQQPLAVCFTKQACQTPSNSRTEPKNPARYLLLKLQYSTNFSTLPIGIYKREFNITAKPKQLSKHKTPHIELALRWWHTNNNYPQYSTFFLQSTSTYPKAWAQEHALIQHHKAPLNYPHIPKHLYTQNSLCISHQAQQDSLLTHTHTATRLWRRVRRATGTLHRPQTPSKQRTQQPPPVPSYAQKASCVCQPLFQRGY